MGAEVRSENFPDEVKNDGANKYKLTKMSEVGSLGCCTAGVKRLFAFLMTG